MVLYITEGPECVGKSTLIQKFISKGMKEVKLEPAIKNRDTPKNEITRVAIHTQQMMMQYAKSKEIFIIDRAHVSNQVYNDIFNRSDHNFLADLEAMKDNVIIFYCFCTQRIARDRLKDRHKITNFNNEWPIIRDEFEKNMKYLESMGFTIIRVNTDKW